MAEPMNVAVIGCGMLARSQHIPNIVRSDKTVPGLTPRTLSFRFETMTRNVSRSSGARSRRHA